MALIKCKECGKEISDSVNSCPHCGYVYKEAKQMTTKKVITIILILVLTCLILSMVLSYLFSVVIPNIQENYEKSKYYGEWQLVDEKYENVMEIPGVGEIEYKLKTQININKDNLENESSIFGSCGFNSPKEFAITNLEDSGCTKTFYLHTTLAKIMDIESVSGYFSSEKIENAGKVDICFEIKDKTLIQKKCDMDNGRVKNINLRYKLNEK